MKKATTILLFFFLAATNLLAQKQQKEPANSFKFGYGTSYLEKGNFTGRTIYLEYDRNLFSILSLGLNATNINGNQTKTGGFEQSMKSYQGDANLFFRIFGNDVNRLKIGGGGSYKKSEYRYTTELIRDTEENIIDKVFETENYQNWGWTGAVEYEVFIAKHIILGSKLMFQQYENGERTYFWGLNVGFRL